MFLVPNLVRLKTEATPTLMREQRPAEEVRFVNQLFRLAA